MMASNSTCMQRANRPQATAKEHSSLYILGKRRFMVMITYLRIVRVEELLLYTRIRRTWYACIRSTQKTHTQRSLGTRISKQSSCAAYVKLYLAGRKSTHTSYEVHSRQQQLLCAYVRSDGGITVSNASKRPPGALYAYYICMIFEVSKDAPAEWVL